MARKASKSKAAAPEGNEEPHGKTISKAEAVRQALAAGMESPADGTGFLKSTYGIQMTSQMWSSYKAQQKARQAKKQDAPKGKPGRKPKAAVDGFLAPPPTPKTPGEETDLLAAIEAMKPLVAALGADKVKRIADLLG